MKRGWRNFLAAAASVSWQVAFKPSLIESSRALWLSFPHHWRAPARRHFHARAFWRSLLVTASRMSASILHCCLLPVAHGWVCRVQGSAQLSPAWAHHRKIMVEHSKTLWLCAGCLAGKTEVVVPYLFVLSPWQNCVWKAVIPLPHHIWYTEMGMSKACLWECPWALSRVFWGTQTWIQMCSTQLARVLGAGQAQTTDLYLTFLGLSELNLILAARDICSCTVIMDTRKQFGLSSPLGSKPPLACLHEQLMASKGCKQGKSVAGRVPLLWQ